MIGTIITSILLLICFIGAIVFTVSYGWFFNYRKTAAGRGLMALIVGFIAVFLMSVIGTFIGIHYPLGHYPGYDVVHWLFYGYLTFTIYHLIWVLWVNRYSGLNVESAPERSITRNRD